MALGAAEGGSWVGYCSGKGGDDGVEGVAVGEIERDVGGDPSAGEAGLARLVRAGGVERELDPGGLALLGFFIGGGEGGTEHGGDGDRAGV